MESFENTPALWESDLPSPKADDNKYDRGHVLVIAGPDMVGAARLAAAGARRVGAGVVTVAAAPEHLAIIQADAPGLLTLPLTSLEDLTSALSHRHVNTVIIGPGLGHSPQASAYVLAALSSGLNCVLDADALTLAENPQEFFKHIHDKCILTPHAGEFEKLFNIEGNKMGMTYRAAKDCGGIVVHKGAKTYICKDRVPPVYNTHAPAALATAGAGDVLSGIIGGLVAQNMPPFKAACAAVWLHGEAAYQFGKYGLIAEDLPHLLPKALKEVHS